MTNVQPRQYRTTEPRQTQERGIRPTRVQFQLVRRSASSQIKPVKLPFPQRIDILRDVAIGKLIYSR